MLLTQRKVQKTHVSSGHCRLRGIIHNCNQQWLQSLVDVEGATGAKLKAQKTCKGSSNGLISSLAYEKKLKCIRIKFMKLYDRSTTFYLFYLVREGHWEL